MLQHLQDGFQATAARIRGANFAARGRTLTRSSPGDVIDFNSAAPAEDDWKEQDFTPCDLSTDHARLGRYPKEDRGGCKTLMSEVMELVGRASG